MRSKKESSHKKESGKAAVEEATGRLSWWNLLVFCLGGVEGKEVCRHPKYPGKCEPNDLLAMCGAEGIFSSGSGKFSYRFVLLR